MRYQVEYDSMTFALSIRELNIIVNLGVLKTNIRRLRELVPLPAVLVYPYMGGVYHQFWYEDLPKEKLTEPRIGQVEWDSRQAKLEAEEEMARPKRKGRTVRGFGR